MRAVNIADLKDNLSSYLKFVLGGEELVIKNRKRPIAKIVPLPPTEDLNEEELALAAEGKLRLPERELTEAFWDRFFSTPGPRVSLKKAARAVVKDRHEE